jgi:Flp pilus assembly pilin Flp
MLNLYCKFKALRAMQSMHSLRAEPDKGVTTVEYALILVGIVIVVGFAVFALGPVIAAQFTATCGALNSGC